ncbi:cell envelope biogenesis protein OmpA [Tamlana sp. I1]|uniref:cell envelope biogenesis protein OmpA n=1 Tax=Tamlana sp. I1 TaxID=2762061 RepID=UPI00188FF72A|nr:cell envelope biogenesis protein OmpA [Tamlana sp. I1]
MISYFKSFKRLWVAIVLIFSSALSQSQGDPKTFKLQFATGINSPSNGGFVEDFKAKPINFPTINLGLQYMFSHQYGAKLDFGYNRFSNKKDTPEFATNYTRINAQLVYDASSFASLGDRMGTFFHAGPGISMITPLGNYGANKTNFMNAMAGVEFHYGINDALTIYMDGSYIFGFGKSFNPITEGYGAFNGNLLTVTIGASISLSGCYYCD